MNKNYSLKKCLRCKKEFQPTSGNQRYCGSERKKIGCSYSKGQERHKIINEKRIRIVNPKQRKRWTYNYYQKHRNEIIFRNNQIRLKKSLIAGYFSKNDWENLKKKFNYTCPMCDKKEPEIKLTQDHIVPTSRGGVNWIKNIQPLCQSCNSSKGNKIL